MKDPATAARESRERQEARHKKIASRAAKRKKKAARAERKAKKVDVTFRAGAPGPGYTGGDRFYSSTEWRQVRYLALKLSEGCCMCCGTRASRGSPLHVDHIVPRWRRPDLSLSLANLQILCEDCNIGKGAWDETDWRPPTRRCTL